MIPDTMRAITQSRYGQPEDVLTLADVPVPQPGPGEVLVEVAAASVNALDWVWATGEPMFARPIALGLTPKRGIAGDDLAGTVVALGPGVTQFRVGDRVFGAPDKAGSFAEYVAAPVDAVAPAPTTLDLTDAAGLGVAALTALQSLRDWGALGPGESVLINGASGGVGSFAVQVAKALGAGHITAVCSTRNVDTAKDSGADEVIDYTSSDPTQTTRRFDVFLDNAGSTTIRQARDVLTPTGRYVGVTARKSRVIHPLPRMLATPLFYLGSPRTANVASTAQTNAPDLAQIARWVDAGLIRPVIEARVPLADAPAAVGRLGRGHARGKTLVIP